MNQNGIAHIFIILLGIALVASLGGAYLFSNQLNTKTSSIPKPRTSEVSSVSAIPAPQTTIKPSPTPIIWNPLPNPTQIPIPVGVITKKKLTVNCKIKASEETKIIDYICNKQNLTQIDPVYINIYTINQQSLKTFSVVYGPVVDWGEVRNTITGYAIGEDVFDQYDKEPYAKLTKSNSFFSSPELLQALKNNGDFFLGTILGILIKDDQDTPQETLRHIYFLKNDEFSRISLTDCTYGYIISDYIRNTDIPKEILEDILYRPQTSPNPNQPENRNNFICDPNKTIKNIIQMNLKSRKTT